MGRPANQLTWFDRRGVTLATVGEPAVIVNLGLSPDDRTLAASQLTQLPGRKAQFDIWLHDLQAGTAARLTDDPGWEFTPAWSSDSASVAFVSNRPSTSLLFSLFTRAANGGGTDIRLGDAPADTPSWGRGSTIVYQSLAGRHGFNRGDTGADLWTVDVSGNREPAVFLNTKHDESDPAFSPDGRWIAYASNATGRNEVYVRAYPSADPSYRVSRDGGRRPRWRRDGRELFFVSPDGRMMAVAVEAADRIVAGVPVRLFATSIRNVRDYVVTGDGQRFLVPVELDEPLRVVLDWRSLLPR